MSDDKVTLTWRKGTNDGELVAELRPSKKLFISEWRIWKYNGCWWLGYEITTIAECKTLKAAKQLAQEASQLLGHVSVQP